MFKRVILAMLALICLSGCSRSEIGAEEVAEYYLKSKSISSGVNITSNTGVMIDYSLICAISDESSKVLVTMPQELSDITADIQSDGATLSFDGASVETLLPPLEGFTPLDAFDGAVRDLKSAIPSETMVGKDKLTFTFEKTFDGYEAAKQVELDKKTMQITGAKFFLNDSMIMEMSVAYCTIS